jgi:hypothetical protein
MVMGLVRFRPSPTLPPVKDGTHWIAEQAGAQLELASTSSSACSIDCGPLFT